MTEEEQKNILNLSTEKTEKTSKNKKIKVFLKVFVILVLVFLIITLFETIDRVNELGERIENLSFEVFMARYRPTDIDLTVEEFQNINESFNILIEGVEPHLSGMKIKGRILNMTSVDYKNTKFNIEVAGKTKELSILEEINAGWARDFELYIPDVPPETESAKINYVESIIGYHEH